MGTLQLGSATTCDIVGLPDAYDPCGEYSVTVTSTSRALGHKIYANIGSLLSGGDFGQTSAQTGGPCRYTADTSVQTSTTFVWKAPNGATSGALIKALCGINVADLTTLLFTSKSVSRNTTSNTFLAGCPAPTSSPTTSSPTSASPTQQPSTAPTFTAPTFSPTLAPRVGPDGLVPATGNWKTNVSYGDLVVTIGTRVQFIWTGFHSVVQFRNQVDFDNCALANATVLSPTANGGNYLLDMPSTAGTLWIACSFGNHCIAQKMKVRIFAEFPQMGPDGSIPVANNNWGKKSYAPLTVDRGQEIKFLWDGLHSLIRFANEADFNACALDRATVVVASQTNGSYVFRASHTGNFWFGCGVAPHCQNFNQKVKISVRSPQVGVDGISPPATGNWKFGPYDTLQVPQDTDVNFNWAGKHSVIQFPDADTFGQCALPSANLLAPATIGGNFNLKTNLLAGETLFIGCGVGAHCANYSMKVKVAVGRTVIGPDAVFPVQPNNWRKRKYSDLRVVKGTDIQFKWEDLHSMVQFLTQDDFDACNLTNAIQINAPTTNFTFTVPANEFNTTLLLGCGVANHCQLGQKIRIFIEPNVVVATQAPVGGGDVGATAAPGAPDAGQQAAATDNAGIIAGSISGVLVGAAALLVYRRSRSRSRSSGEIKREIPNGNNNDPEMGNGGNGQYLIGSDKFPHFSVHQDNYTTPASAIPSVRLSFFSGNTQSTPSSAPSVPSRSPAPSSSFAPLSGAMQSSSSFSSVGGMAAIRESVSEMKSPAKDLPEESLDTLSKFGSLKKTAKASADSLKKSFKEKREIAMKSFRPIVALDVSMPPPPFATSEAPSDSSHRVFRPSTMYGAQPLPIIMSSTQKQQPAASVGSAPSSSVRESVVGQSAAPAMRQPSASPQSSMPSSSASSTKSTQFMPSAADMSSPDNFTGVASKIKQSMRGKAQTGSVVPPSGSGASQQKSSMNPMYETLHEGAADEDDSGDENGAGKLYGSKQNHPLFNRTLSV